LDINSIYPKSLVESFEMRIWNNSDSNSCKWSVPIQPNQDCWYYIINLNLNKLCWTVNINGLHGLVEVYNSNAILVVHVYLRPTLILIELIQINEYMLRSQ